MTAAIHRVVVTTQATAIQGDVVPGKTPAGRKGAGIPRNTGETGRGGQPRIEARSEGDFRTIGTAILFAQPMDTMTATDTLLATLLATLAPDPLIRGQQFERFVVTLLRTHPLLGVGAGGSLALGGVAGHVVAG